MLRTRRSRKAARPRNPGRTRETLLRAAFDEVYRSGFRGSDLDSILAKAHVTKGALYHHFESKEGLGYALVDEILARITSEKWVMPLENSENAIDTLIEIVQGTSMKQEHVEGGCPVNNLAQEMSPLDEGFRKRLANVFNSWISGVAEGLEKGQKKGQVRGDLDAHETAMYLAATYEGYMSFAKNAQDARVLQAGKKAMVRYLETLRPANLKAI